jgi:hypothetical protein
MGSEWDHGEITESIAVRFGSCRLFVAFRSAKGYVHYRKPFAERKATLKRGEKRIVGRSWEVIAVAILSARPHHIS